MKGIVEALGPGAYLLSTASCSWVTVAMVSAETGKVEWEDINKIVPVLSDGEKVIVEIARWLDVADACLDVSHKRLVIDAAKQLLPPP